MKFREIFRFEFAYQIRRVSTWLYFTVLVVIAFLFVRGNFLADALYADFYLNSPFVIASVAVFCSLFGFLITAAVAGEAAARDVGTGMHPLTYTSPVSKSDYLGGRFLAAFALNALIQIAVPVGVMLAVYLPGVEAGVIGPFRPAAYLIAYGYITLPNAFAGTAIQFAWAALGRRAIASYFGSVFLFFVAYGGIIFLGFYVERQDLAALLDVFAHVTITSESMLGWTAIEKSTRLLKMEGMLLQSRLFWFGVALATLAFTRFRFRFTHVTARPWWKRIARRSETHALNIIDRDNVRAAITIPQVPRMFGFATYALQTLILTWTSFLTILVRRGGFIVLMVTLLFVFIFVPENMSHMGTPLLPRTDYVITFLTASLGTFATPWVAIPLIIVIYSGELVWREQEAGLGEMTDATPTPEWAFFLSKFFALGLFLALWMAFLIVAGLLAQLRLGYHEFEIGLYGQVLFGLQLPEYLLFAALALTVHVLTDQKYIGHLVALLVYATILFSAQLGIQHNLLVYGSRVGWSYSDMRGFGGSLEPWLWFKLYWVAWALLLAVVARLLWVRGIKENFRARLRLARLRFTRPTARVAAVAAGLILCVGGFIFFNTNVLHEYNIVSEQMKRRAEYERQYGRYKEVPQPRLTATMLRLEIYPDRRTVEIQGTYHLVNGTSGTIDSIHLSTIRSVQTGAINFDRPATPVVEDDDLGHRIYVLKEPLQPGDSLQLRFEVHYQSRGFGNSGVNASVVANGTYFKNTDLLPAIGYQARREILKPGERRKYGLPARPLIPSLEDVDVTGEEHDEDGSNEGIAFEAIVGTDENQMAVAPGALRRTWAEGGRRYFHYASDVPIGDEQRFFSARYIVREELWNDPTGSGRQVAIQVVHHPTHTANVDRMLRSARASLSYYSREFGSYPWGYLRLVENPGRGIGAHAEAAMIDFTQGFSRFDPTDDPQDLDLPFAVIAHEIAHQWWGAQLGYAPVEGAGLLTESAAWYSAMGVVEETYGREHLRRLLRFFRQPHPIPPIRQSVPLLRAADPYAFYRKGPFALYAMSEYMGKDKVNRAYRRLLEKHLTGEVPLPTSLDLYRELKAVTPDSLQVLLHDLFEANTFWDLGTKQATAKQTEAGAWQVTLQLRARKVVVDPAGVETEMPMDEWVQIGVFAPTGTGAEFGETLYLQMRRIRSGEQTITVTVPRKPADAGIDPYHLLIELERFDNVENVKVNK